MQVKEIWEMLVNCSCSYCWTSWGSNMLLITCTESIKMQGEKSFKGVSVRAWTVTLFFPLSLLEQVEKPGFCSTIFRKSCSRSVYPITRAAAGVKGRGDDRRGALDLESGGQIEAQIPNQGGPMRIKWDNAHEELCVRKAWYKCANYLIKSFKYILKISSKSGCWFLYLKIRKSYFIYKYSASYKVLRLKDYKYTDFYFLYF